MLREFIALNRAQIITRCRAKVALRSVPAPRSAIDHGVPAFLDQLVHALGAGAPTSHEIRDTAIQHGHDLRLQGLTMSQVVHDYGDICQSITELALETDAPISVHEFRTLNRCLDDAIAGAVTEYGRESSRESAEGEAARGSERLGFFTHELRNLINTATIAFEILETGNVGIGGSTSAVLRRSLLGLGALVSRGLAEVRLTEGVQNRETFLVSRFVEELGAGAIMEATNRGITLEVLAVDEDLMILADRQVLSAVVVNLLQNACKFSKTSSTVTLRVGGGRSGSSSKSRMRAAACRARGPAISSARSSSVAPTAAASAWAWRSAGGRWKRTAAGSTRAMCRVPAACLPSIFLGCGLRSSRRCRRDRLGRTCDALVRNLPVTGEENAGG